MLYTIDVSGHLKNAITVSIQHIVTISVVSASTQLTSSHTSKVSPNASHQRQKKTSFLVALLFAAAGCVCQTFHFSTHNLMRNHIFFD